MPKYADNSALEVLCRNNIARNLSLSNISCSSLSCCLVATMIIVYTNVQKKQHKITKNIQFVALRQKIFNNKYRIEEKFL